MNKICYILQFCVCAHTHNIWKLFLLNVIFFLVVAAVSLLVAISGHIVPAVSYIMNAIA